MELKIAKDFSRIPGARYPEEGDYSGQTFRTEFLLPKLKEAIEKGEQLVVNLDGTAGLGTSFLEESFGGLVRENDFDETTLKRYIVLVSNEDPDYIDEVWLYVKDAYEQK